MSRHYALNAIAENALGLVQDYYRNPLTARNWIISSEWMYEVQTTLDLKDRTLFAGFYLANEILARLWLTKKDFQIVLITALHLSDAHDDWIHPKLEDYLELTEDAYTLDRFELFIQNVIVLLEGRTRPPTVYDILESINFDQPDPFFRDAVNIATLSCIYYPEVFTWNLDTFAKACLLLAHDLNTKQPGSRIRNDPAEALLLARLVQVTVLQELALQFEEEGSRLLILLERRKNFLVKAVEIPTFQDGKVLSNKAFEEPIPIKELGKGTYGSVKLVKKEGAQYANKKQPLNDNALIELNILTSYQHENLVTIYGFQINENELYMDLEFGISLQKIIKSYDKTDLWSWTDVYIRGDTKSSLPVVKRRKLQKGILAGLAYLHSQGIIHRDIKLDNIVLVGDRPKLIDYGLAYEMCLSTQDENSKSSGVYSLFQRPPELLWAKSEMYAFEIDVWACAAAMLEIETGIIPFYWDLNASVPGINDNYTSNIIYAMSKILGSPEKVGIYKKFPLNQKFSGLLCVQDNVLRNILLDMLPYQPEERITLVEAVERLM